MFLAGQRDHICFSVEIVLEKKWTEAYSQSGLAPSYLSRVMLRTPRGREGLRRASSFCHGMCLYCALRNTKTNTQCAHALVQHNSLRPACYASFHDSEVRRSGKTGRQTDQQIVVVGSRRSCRPLVGRSMSRRDIGCQCQPARASRLGFNKKKE